MGGKGCPLGAKPVIGVFPFEPDHKGIVDGHRYKTYLNAAKKLTLAK